jgi:probable rRNA maturation factor
VCTEKSPGLRSTTLKALLRGALVLLGRPRATVSLVLTGDATLQRLNRDYLETDRATDVLSFPLADLEELRDPARACFLGEIYISLARAREQARVAKRPYHAEVAHLAIHGLLHLIGHDHPTPDMRRRMKTIEARLLRLLAPTIERLL